MTDHTWSQEQIATYLAGGLSAQEAERLEQHALECAECAAALAAAKHLDRGLGTLFSPLRPQPGLEDRAILSIRVAPRPRAIFFIGWPRRATALAAGLIIFMTFGALAGSLMTDGRLPLPGERQTTYARAGLEPAAAPAGSPFSLVPDLAGLDNSASMPNLDTTAEKTFQEIVTSDPVGVPNLQTDDKTAKEPGLATEGFGGRASATTSRVQTSGGGNNRNGTYSSHNGPVPPAGWSAQGIPNGGGMMGMGGGMMGFNGGMGGGIMGMGGNPMLGGGFANYYGVPRQGVMPPAASTAAPAGAPAGPTRGYFVPTDGKPLLGSLATGETKWGDKDGPPSNKSGESGQKPPGTKAPPPSDPKGGLPAAEPTRRIVVRSGDIEFEIESFDSALATVTQLVTGIKGAFVGTVNSDKLANGKVRGSIVVRTPPESLDSLVLDLRKELGKGGDLKSVKLASADITKQYTDLESRLRAARAMETRLLDIIKTGKGEIKQLLEAERELGIWRTKIEENEGELRYYANLAALSTLTITLTEKELRAAVGVTENERVQAGVEVEDVDKTYQAVLKEIVDAKGRVTKSELKQLSAGQFNATLNFEVSPEAGGPIRDRLRQLGRVARLEIDRIQQADGPVVPKGAKITRGDTVFLVQLYNLANIAPRETAVLSVAVADVPAAYNAIRDAIAKASARVQNAQLNEQDRQNITAQLDFDVKRTDEAAMRAALAAAGEATARTVVRAPESDSVTDTKILYRVTLYPVQRLRPRDSITLQLAVPNVAASYQSIRETVLAAKGRVLASNLDENDKQNVNATLDFEVQRADEAAVKGALEGAGETVSRQLTHLSQNEAATDSKLFYSLKLLPANRLKPRETNTLGLEVPDVDRTVKQFIADFNEVKGRQIDAKTGRERNGKTSARLIYEVPLATAQGLVERFKNEGTVRVLNSSRDPQAPEGKSATARIDVTLANTESIVSPDDGLWPPVKKGLSYSASVLLTSMTWVVFGLCVVLPWAIVGYGGYRVVRRFSRPKAEAQA
jgi:hypothetical protein